MAWSDTNLIRQDCMKWDPANDVPGGFEVPVWMAKYQEFRLRKWFMIHAEPIISPIY